MLERYEGNGKQTLVFHVLRLTPPPHQLLTMYTHPGHHPVITPSSSHPLGSDPTPRSPKYPFPYTPRFRKVLYCPLPIVPLSPYTASP